MAPSRTARILPAFGLLVSLAIVAGCHTLTTVSPNPAAAGNNITLTGTGFGATQGAGDSVTYDNQSIAVVSWSDTQIVATIPVSKPAGTYQVKVYADNQASSPLSHTLLPAGTLVAYNLKFTVNPKSVLSGTLSFNTNYPATPSASVTNATVGTWNVPASGRLSSAPGTTHSFAVVGMRSAVQQTFNVSADDGAGHVANAGPVTYTPAALPSDTPPFTTLVSTPALMQPGYTVITMGADESAGGGNVYALDAAGKVVWYHQDSNIGTHIVQGSNGHFYFVKSKGINDPAAPNGTIVELDNLNNVVNQWTAASLGIDSMHHDFRELPNGNFLVIATELRSIAGYPTESLCPSGVCNVVGDVIVEFTRAGSVVSSIPLLDIIDVHRVPNWASFNNPNYNLLYQTNTRDGMRCTAIQYLEADDSVLVSCKVQSIIFKLNRATQSMDWVIGEDLPDTTVDDAWPFLPLVGPGLLPSEQHGPEIVPNGNLIVLDNGELHVPQVSRSVEYSFDFLNGNISQVWEYIDPAWSPSLYDYGGGDIDYLANGNYLISNNGLGEPPIPFGLNWSEYAEVRRSDSTKVWEIIIRDPAETKNYTGFEAKRIGSLYP